MFLKPALAIALTLAAAAALAPTAHADALAVTPPKPAHKAPRAAASALPQRGMSMAQVERGFGAPVSKLPTAGGDSPRHPPINRWRYDGYTVYFERSRVIHSVADASALATQP